MKPLCLLAAHVEYPETTLSDKLLCELLETEVDAVFLEDRCPRQTYTSLSPEHIRATKNRDWWKDRRGVELSATDLGCRAVVGALERARLVPDQVGLVVAATLTPLETCPAEATRIASALGLHVPSFDVVCGSVSMLAMIEGLSSWRAHDLPEYVVCVTTHVPTQFIDFSGPEGLVFGDGAAAVVLSRAHEGEFLVKRAWTCPSSPVSEQYSLDIYSSVSLRSLTIPHLSEDAAYFRDILDSSGMTHELHTATISRRDRELFLQEISRKKEHPTQLDAVEKGGFVFDVSLVAQLLAHEEARNHPSDATTLLMPQGGCYRGGLILTRPGRS